ncbi:hypothetical protein HGP17_11525 [Rhizobium sp. P38BS-XIX]|nr:hypothetical protein [Rhizobium sp. P38BS-XIX]
MSTDVHTQRGKWSEPHVPHRGWSCVGVDDLEEPSQVCEMCESVDIRYVHYMEHPDYPETLAVGCVCAEHMEEDYARPRAREKDLRRLAARRKTWRGRKWRISHAGNSYLNSEGFNLTVYRGSEGYRIAVSRRGTAQRQAGRKWYPSEEEAKAAALGALIWAKTHL